MSARAAGNQAAQRAFAPWDPGTRATLAAGGIAILEQNETLELYQGAEFPQYAGHLTYLRQITIITPRRNVATLEIHGYANFPAGTQLPLPKAGPPYPPGYHHTQPGDPDQLEIPAATSYRWIVSVEYADATLRKWLPSTYHPEGGNEALQGSASLAETASPAPLFAKLQLTPWAQCKSLADFVDRSEDAAREEAHRIEGEAEELDVEPPAPPGPAEATDTVSDTPSWKPPPWLQGILKALGKALLGIGIVVGLAALIASLPLDIGFGAAVLWIGATLLAYSFVRSLIGRIREAAQGDVRNPLSVLGAAVLDAIGVSSFIEALSDRSFLTGRKLNRSEEERWEEGTSGALTFVMTLFGVRSTAKRVWPAPEPPIQAAPPPEPAPARPPLQDHPGMDQWTEGHDPAPQVITRLRQARCTIGEQGVAFSGYPQSEGWGFIEGPSGGGGHAWNAPGFDGVAFRVAGPFEVEVIDNKAFASEGNVSSSSALTRNLQTNLGDLAAQIADPVYNDVPRIADLRSAISRAQAAVQNGSPLPPEVRLVVTNFGGRSGGITATLQALGITFRDVNR